MKFSIIISVYNLENYIAKCLDSLVCQDFQDYEIIVINDGSTDSSEDICKKYEFNNRHKIKFFSKPNGGASSARNYGLPKANGEYIIFMDGDDYWDNNRALTFLDEKINMDTNPDIIIFGCKDRDENTGDVLVSRGNYDVSLLENSPKEKIIEKLVKDNQFPGAAWIVCARKEFLIQNNITFKEGIKAEDIDWIYSVLRFSKRITFLNQSFYIYRKNRKDSATFSFNDKSVAGILYTIDKWTPIIKSEKDLEYLFFNLNFHYLLTIVFAKNITKEQVLSINNNKILLNYSLTLREKLVSKIIKLLGIKTSLQLFKYVSRKKS